MQFNPKTIYDKVSEEGDSPIYVGINYLKIVASQIDMVRLSSRRAYIEKGDILFHFLHELRTFYDLVESRSGLDSSDKNIESFKYELIDNKMQKTEIKIKEGKKYEHLFNEIEQMIERNASVVITDEKGIYKEKKYLNDKKILLELSRCWRGLMRDANRNHLIMPEGIKDMKKMVKEEWIDRKAKKNFSD